MSCSCRVQAGKGPVVGVRPQQQRVDVARITLQGGVKGREGRRVLAACQRGDPRLKELLQLRRLPRLSLRETGAGRRRRRLLPSPDPDRQRTGQREPDRPRRTPPVGMVGTEAPHRSRTGAPAGAQVLLGGWLAIL